MENKLIDKTEQTEKGCSKDHAGFRHLGMMLICCLVPLAAAFILKQLGYSGIASYLILFLCPIMHLFMMKGMFTNQDKPQSDGKQYPSRGNNG